MDNFQIAFMQRALELAHTARYHTSPNPRVGCVLVKNGKVLGEGATQVAGKDHAEISAIKHAMVQGHSIDTLNGSTAYVTLEPCNHIGKTGACSQALINIGVTQVFALMVDPNPLTAEQGLAHLRAAGIKVWCGNECNESTNNTNLDLDHRIYALIQSANELNIGFFKQMKQGVPWFRLKIASSVDGYIALPNGQSQWLTSAAAQQDTHHWRASSCAILTGIGTVLKDNPLLNVRHVSTIRQPLRIVLDTHLRIPLDSKLICSHSEISPVLIIYGKKNTNFAKQQALNAMGIELLAIDTVLDKDKNTEHIDLQAVYFALGNKQLNEIHCEAGGILNGALLQTDMIDEIILYQAPLLLGKGLHWSNGYQDYTHLSQIKAWNFHHIQPIGNDVRLILRPDTVIKP